MTCQKCIVPRKNPVKFSGNPTSNILFLFDNPAPYDKRIEVPDILAKICKNFPEVFVASACRCWFDKSKLTGGQINSIVDECKNNLDILSLQALLLNTY